MPEESEGHRLGASVIHPHTHRGVVPARVALSGSGGGYIAAGLS